MLCVVAHPDDMEYGASAAVAQWTAQGVEVSYLLLTAGEAGIRNIDPATTAALRAKEQKEACAIVGVDDLSILDLPDGLLEPSLATRATIAKEIRRVKPQAVMVTNWDLEVPWGINHVDHRAAGLATVDAIRDADSPWIFPEQLNDEVQTWSTTWLLVTGAEPTHVIELGKEAVEKGIASLEAHKVYLEALPDHPPARQIVEGAAGAGQQAGVEYGLGIRVIPMG